MAYQAESQRLEDQATITDAERAYLEELQMQYEATKKVKEDLILAEVAGRLAAAKQENGLDGLAEVADAAADVQLALMKKIQEFPGDEETSLALTAAETDVHLIQAELERLATSDEVSVRETESILDLAQSAKEKEAYNRLYAEALPIARGGDEMEFEMYFAALEAQFQDVEEEYNWAVAEKQPNAAELGEEFDRALLDFNAALDVQFDVVEAVDQETLIPEVVLTEDEEEELKEPIKDARAVDGGYVDIKNLLKSLFDDVTALESQLAKDKEDRDTQDALGRARTVYVFSTDYADETVGTQVGEIEEEAAPADAVAEVVINENEAAELEAQIAEQRAAEQAAIQAAVDAANAEVEAAEAAQAETERKQAEAEAAAAEAAAEVTRLEELLAAAESGEGSRRRKLADGDLTIEEIRG